MIKNKMTLNEKFKNMLQIQVGDILHLSPISAIISVNYHSPKVMLITIFADNFRNKKENMICQKD